MIRIKRVYDRVSPDDGERVLVDRLWPRGVSRAAAAITAWARELAPSDDLRRWFGHRAERWAEFRRRYHAELAARRDALAALAARARRRRLTLLYAAADPERNNAVVLKEALEGLRAAPRSRRGAPGSGGSAGRGRTSRSPRRGSPGR